MIKWTDYFVAFFLFTYYGGLSKKLRKLQRNIALNSVCIIYFSSIILSCCGFNMIQKLPNRMGEIHIAAGPAIFSYQVNDNQYPLEQRARVTQNFGVYNSLHEFKFRHAGIDLSCALRSKVHAMQNGVVVHSGWLGRYGFTVIIKHNDGIETVYAHLSKIFKQRGAIVSANDVIALSGSTGESTGPHLHFEVRQDGKTINPNLMMRF
jgi:murein DD-endopeptidase MepM/ murein hydrolase activator NlpD